MRNDISAQLFTSCDSFSSSVIMYLPHLHLLHLSLVSYKRAIIASLSPDFYALLFTKYGSSKISQRNLLQIFRFICILLMCSYFYFMYFPFSMPPGFQEYTYYNHLEHWNIILAYSVL